MSSKIRSCGRTTSSFRWRAAGGDLTSTISSPIRVAGVAKVPARPRPELGEHNDELLKELGFDATEIDGLRVSGAIRRNRAKAS